MSTSPTLTHFDASGLAHMVDVSAKANTHRVATAQGRIVMSANTLAMIEGGSAKKGDVLGVARLAGIMAAKKTSDLIPLCHPLAITRVAIEFVTSNSMNKWTSEQKQSKTDDFVSCKATVETVGPTGVEMEALTACTVALLTVYDMCKAVDRAMVLQGVKVLEKSGGKSGHFTHPDGSDVNKNL